ncbi:MAG: glycogen debranching enzyme N-terminal domain-containing protein [Deltaproteobacteria bacterium]|nr:glycogen debranching enzyme N-terminal domain-containing protein [Deltaproteobacteria bacterium]
MFLSRLQILREREWILTNGLGGYALGFGDLLPKRKYNGLLIAGMAAMKRIHVLSSLEERVESSQGTFFLDATSYGDVIHPRGHEHLVNVGLRPYPSFLFSSRPYSSRCLLLKEVLLTPGMNAVVISYTNLGKDAIQLGLRPKFTLRDHHGLIPPGMWDRVPVHVDIDGPQFKLTREDSGFRVYGYVEHGKVIRDQVIYRSVHYPLEALRGYDSIEDLIAPVAIEMTLQSQSKTSLLISTEPQSDPAKVVEKTYQHDQTFPVPKDAPARRTLKPFRGDVDPPRKQYEREDYLAVLSQMASECVLEDHDVCAGYPWFGAWGRDTLICLLSFGVLPDGKEKAVALLKKYGAALRQGLLPNTFGEGGEGQNFDSIDAPLWYVINGFLHAPKDHTIWQHIQAIIVHFIHSHHDLFLVGDDGLIEIRPSSKAMTWMDAIVFGQPVTPRFGKPVEINALWINALETALQLAKQNSAKGLESDSLRISLPDLARLLKAARTSFKMFIGPDFLADRLEEGTPVWEPRPNAVIAAALPFDVVDGEALRMIWMKAKAELLTPHGLRSLSPMHSAFREKYVGNQKQRDLAYHQGTVWTYLLLFYGRLVMKVFPQKKQAAKELEQAVATLRQMLMNDELASLPEVWDGVRARLPKGCPSQAWSIFAVLEMEHLIEELKYS